MRSGYSTLGLVLVLALAAFVLWFIFVNRVANDGPSASDVPPGTTPRLP